MLPAFDAKKTTKYISPLDTDEVKTEFIIGVLDVKEEAYLHTQYTALTMVNDAGRDDEKKISMTPKISIDKDGRDIETVMLGLKGVNNFPYELTFTEKMYPFGKRTVLSDASLNHVKPYIGEIAEAISEANKFTPEAEKN